MNKTENRRFVITRIQEMNRRNLHFHHQHLHILGYSVLASLPPLAGLLPREALLGVDVDVPLIFYHPSQFP